MNLLEFKILKKLARYGVVGREEVKNNPLVLKYFLTRGCLRRVYRGREVYYELTDKSLPLLEEYRKIMGCLSLMAHHLHPRSRLFSALLFDLRFLDEKRKEAKDFLFLGDWQLTRPVSRYQLELAKERFYTGGAS